MFRDHQPLVIEQFMGLWDRGDIEDTPMDHFSDCVNLIYPSDASFKSRNGLKKHQNTPIPLGSILRIYNYPTSDKQTILVLVEGGSIYHIVDPTTVFGPILTIAGMIDFGFTPYAGRAYISPFITELVGELNRERGMQNQWVYVYKGDGTQARIAGGTAPLATPTIGVSNGGGGHTEAGVHIFGYVYETDTGYQSAPGGLVAHTTTASNSVDFSAVANSPDPFVTKKHIVASKVIQDYNGDVNGYALYFIPEATIPNNVTTTLGGISFYDSELLLDAGHLLDNFDKIPAGVGLCTYHNRLCVWTEYDNISLVRVSFTGEPEAISKVDGILLVPPDGNPVTNAAELRDVLYVFKRNKTVSFVDNGDIPASWPLSIVDNAMGCGVHGIATVIDAGASNIDYLLVGAYKGVTLFNGRYILPELSWKIQRRWLNQDFKKNNRRIQLVNDSVEQIAYIVMTDRTVMYANYALGYDPKSIRWCPWTFDVKVNSLCFININELLLGCDQK